MVLAEAVDGWRVGDRVILTATHRQKVPDEGKVPSARVKPETEERTIRSIDGTKLTLDSPLAFNHSANGAAARRSRQSESQRDRGIGRPGGRRVGTRCITGTRPGRSRMPSFGIWERLEISANTAFISIGLGTRCGGRRWSVHRSGTVGIAG